MKAKRNLCSYLFAKNTAIIYKIVSFLYRTVESGYNDIRFYETSSIASDILWYQLIPHC
jgi:hypothetical protein